MTLSAPTPALAYSIPSLYVNNVQMTCINGMFRVTFFEQLASAEGPPLAALAPRCSVTMTLPVARELAHVLSAFVKQVEEHQGALGALVVPAGTTRQ